MSTANVLHLYLQSEIAEGRPLEAGAKLGTFRDRPTMADANDKNRKLAAYVADDPLDGGC